MDPNQKIEDTEYEIELVDDETAEVSVDDFIRELEEKEKDLHITADTTFIEIAGEFEDEAEIPDFMRQEIAQSKTQTVKPAAATGNVSTQKLEAEIGELKAKIVALQEERSELYKNSQRRLKDFDAFKSRTERERSETFQRQLSNLATQMLPVLDNLDRALDAASSMSDEKQGEFTQFFDGIVLVNQQLNEVLVGMGIDPIATVGEQFDPHFHEAVAIDENSEQPANTVTAELLRGFRIGNTVIRHSMVKVSKSAAAFPVESRSEQTEPDDDMDFDEADTQLLTGKLPTLGEQERVDFDMSYADKVNDFEIERNGTTGTGDGDS